MRTFGRALRVAVVGAVLLDAQRAAALPITWTFDGNLRLTSGSVPQALQALGVEVGALVHGFVRFESNTPDQYSGPDAGQYYNSVEMAAITVGDWSLARGIYYPNPEFTANDLLVSYYPPDLFGIQSQIDMYDPTATFDGWVLAGFGLSTRTPGVISSDALLIDPPALASLDPFGFDAASAYGYGTEGFLVGCGQGGCMEYHIELSSLQRVSLTPPLPIGLPGVPEPSLISLVALAAAGASGRRPCARLRD